MAFNTITNKTYIDVAHIDDVIGIDDTSDTSGLGGTPVTKKVGLGQIQDYVNVGYGIPLQHFQSKLAQVKKGTLSKVRIGMIGDSTFAAKGAGGGDPWGNSPAAVLQQLFQNAGFNATGASFYASGDGTNASAVYNSKRLALSGVWATQATPTLGGNLYFTTTTAGSLSFTPTDYWDTAVVTYMTNGTQGTFTTDIDGGPVTTTNGNGATGIAQYTQTTATPGIHTINWKYVSGTKVFASGVECYNSTLSQVMVVNCGWGGVTTGGIAAGSGAFDPIQALQFAAFDLVVFGTVINDWLTTTNQVTLATQATSLITAARAGGGDCVWMLSVPSIISSATLAVQQSYCAVIRGVCLSLNVPVIDIFDRFQSYEISQPIGLYSDTIHPNGPGYEIMGNAIFNMLNVHGESQNIKGIIDGSVAKAGVVGEVLISKVASGSAVGITSGTIGDVLSLALQPGAYNLSGVLGLSGTITGTVFQGFIGTASGNNSTGRDTSLNTVQIPLAPTVGSDVIDAIPVYPINISVPTTYYLKVNSTFTIGTLTAYGSITATRTR